DRAVAGDKMEVELLIKRRVHRFRRMDGEERIPTRSRTHDGLGGDVSPGPRPVLDDELLAEPLRQPLADQARDDVGAAAGGEADDDAHRPRRAGVPPCDPPQHPPRASALCGMEKITAVVVLRMISRSPTLDLQLSCTAR